MGLERARRNALSGLSQSTARLERRRAVVLDPIADGDLTDRHRHGRLGRWPDQSPEPSCPLRRRGRPRSRGSAARIRGSDIAGFHIYGESTPGAASTTRPYWRPYRPTSPESSPTDLATGVSARGVRPIGRLVLVDLAAALGGHLELGRQTVRHRRQRRSAQTTAVTIAAPPLPPAPFPNMTRLQYTYSTTRRTK